MKQPETQPRYLEIAIDLAQQIKQRKIKTGQKLKGRSLAASHYNVSPETIRKSLHLLAEFQIITIKDKSGAFVESRDAAIDFLAFYRKRRKVDQTFQTISELIQTRKRVDRELEHQLKTIKNHVHTAQTTIPIEHFAVTLHADHDLVGTPAGDTDWPSTSGATLFGVESVSRGILSSVPRDYVFQAGDVLHFSGTYEISQKTIDFIKK